MHVQSVESAVIGLTPEQRVLAVLMADISESVWASGWQNDVEYILWRAVITGSGTGMRRDFTPEELHELKRLSDVCGGWIVWDESVDDPESYCLRFVPHEEWARMVEMKWPTSIPS